jgi:hypothetical protein
MHIRADLTRPASVSSTDFAWVDSPLPGVQRVMLDRVGDEVAIATSLVRYAPGSSFDPHQHGGGEEFLVLDGVFSDEHGDYPTGTYVRNPPGTSHRPFSDQGCVLFVKLWQFDPEDNVQLSVELTGEPQLLFERGAERVQILTAAADSELLLEPCEKAQEVLVLEGSVVLDEQIYGRWSWLRLPAGQGTALASRPDSVLFHKTRPIFRTSV